MRHLSALNEQVLRLLSEIHALNIMFDLQATATGIIFNNTIDILPPSAFSKIGNKQQHLQTRIPCHSAIQDGDKVRIT